MAIVYSTGFEQSISNDGSKSKPVINEIEWNADYKKNKGTMNVNINKNGKKNKYQVKLNKNDLENLLKMPSVNQSIDKRLKEDFIMLDSPLTTSKYKTTPNTFLHNNDYSELERLFTLRKKLLNPYHLTHTTPIKTPIKTLKKTSKKNPQKKAKTRKNKANKGRGTRKNSSFFSNFSNML
jgi:hypothetical protein